MLSLLFSNPSNPYFIVNWPAAHVNFEVKACSPKGRLCEAALRPCRPRVGQASRTGTQPGRKASWLPGRLYKAGLWPMSGLEGSVACPSLLGAGPAPLPAAAMCLLLKQTRRLQAGVLFPAIIFR